MQAALMAHCHLGMRIFERLIPFNRLFSRRKRPVLGPGRSEKRMTACLQTPILLQSEGVTECRHGVPALEFGLYPQS